MEEERPPLSWGCCAVCCLAGHVAHVNIRDDILRFRYVIGQVLLDVSSCLRGCDPLLSESLRPPAEREWTWAEQRR